MSSFVFVLLITMSVTVYGGIVVHKDESDNLLQGLNSYRQAQNLPLLVKNENAECIANEIAEDMENQPCTVTSAKANVVASRPSQLTNFPKYADECKVDINSTADAVIMPVCVPKLVQTLLLANYTHSQYAKYLNDSRFVGAGLGSENDWMVVVLASSLPAGNFAASGAYSLAASSLSGLLGLLFLGVFSVIS